MSTAMTTPTTSDTPATVHRLPPARRPVPTEAQRQSLAPFAEQLRSLSDTHFGLAFEAMIDEVRRRRLAHLVSGAAHDLTLERMSGSELEALAGALDASNGLGGIA